MPSARSASDRSAAYMCASMLSRSTVTHASNSGPQLDSIPSSSVPVDSPGVAPPETSSNTSTELPGGRFASTGSPRNDSADPIVERIWPRAQRSAPIGSSASGKIDDARWRRDGSTSPSNTLASTAQSSYPQGHLAVRADHCGTTQQSDPHDALSGRPGDVPGCQDQLYAGFGEGAEHSRRRDSRGSPGPSPQPRTHARGPPWALRTIRVRRRSRGATRGSGPRSPGSPAFLRDRNRRCGWRTR